MAPKDTRHVGSPALPAPPRTWLGTVIVPPVGSTRRALSGHKRSCRLFLEVLRKWIFGVGGRLRHWARRFDPIVLMLMLPLGSRIDTNGTGETVNLRQVDPGQQGVNTAVILYAHVAALSVVEVADRSLTLKERSITKAGL